MRIVTWTRRQALNFLISYYANIVETSDNYARTQVAAENIRDLLKLLPEGDS